MYTIMFWNKYNEALIINEPYTSQLSFDTYQEAWDAIKDAVVDMIAKGAVCVSLTIPWGDSEWYSIEA
jgi:hypothetical protein